MVELWHVLAALAGFLVVAVVFQDVFEVMLLPRRVQRRVRLVRLYYRGAWRAWTALAPTGERGGTFLSHFGALSMVLLFAVWATALVCGFGLMHWGLQGAPQPNRAASPLSEQLYMSGVTFFTLGYGDVAPHSAASRALAVAESGLGIGFIAVVISYLPVIHQYFSRREAHVMQLDGRAGSPPTAATLLLRHADPAELPVLNEYLREWEVWSAELLESHLSYPMLAYYRSQHENQSWLGALGCILDTAALVLVGAGGLRPLQARLTFSAGRSVLVEMARSFGVLPLRHGYAGRLDADGLARLEALMRNAGLPWPGADAGELLAVLRTTYEPLLAALALHLRVAMPRWLPDGGDGDNWEGGPRGMVAGLLVDGLASGPDSAREGRRRTLLRRLRRHGTDGGT